jgi:two-component system chemotaxis response regulator CheB
MGKKRILLVVDSVVMRRALMAALSRNSEIETAASAPNGSIALMKIPLLHPDVVALDSDLPETDGLETLAAIRAAHPQLPVIMLNPATDRGAAATLDALTLGAKDYITKPDITTSSDEALQAFSDELASKIALCCPQASFGKPTLTPPAPISPGGPANGAVVSRPVMRADVVAIGASVGGPNALMNLIPRFPSNFPVPIVIVQHMPAVFTKLLAARLAAKCKIHVAEGTLHQTLMPGEAWIAPGDVHMAVERKGQMVRIQTWRGPPVNSCRPAADVLFRSVANVYGVNALAVVMTGMGQDGLHGCQEIRAAGGQVLVQDEPSSVVWGMPGFVVRAGIADRVLPLDELGPEIIKRVWRHRLEAGAPLPAETAQG